jgi:Ca-activated chloride channel family protein
MVAMARRGGGNHYYGDTAADLFEPFAAEFDFISSLCARHVRLSVTGATGVSGRLLNDYPVEGDVDIPRFSLPDIAFGAEAWALVELEIAAGAAVEGAGRLLQVAVTAATPGGEPLAFADAQLTLPAVSIAAWEILLADPLVVARQSELAAGKLLEQARAAARLGDWQLVERLLAEARQRFADQPWVIEVLAGIAELARLRDTARFSKEALYAARSMDSRLSATQEASYDSPATEWATTSFLRRRKSQGKAQS